MGLTGIGQLGVNFIRQHHDIGAAQHLRDFLELCTGHHAAGRIGGKRQNQELRLRRNRLPQLLRGQRKAVFRFGGDRHDLRLRHLRDRPIADEAGLDNHHLVAGIDQRADAHIDRLAAADGNEHLVVGRIFKLKASFEVPRNLNFQLFKTGVGSVPGSSLFQRADPRAAHRPGGLKIRFPDPEGDHILHLGGEVEKLSDARRLHFLNGSGKYPAVIHQTRTSRISCSASERMPRSL